MRIRLNHNGKDLGEFEQKQIENLIESGLIRYETLGWSEGMSDWAPIKEIIGTPVVPSAPKASISSNSPTFVRYFMPVGRIGRGMFLLRTFTHLMLLGLLMASLPDPYTSSYSHSSLDLLIMVFVLVWGYVSIMTTGKRLHDLGVTAWASPLFFIPIVPLVLMFVRGTDGENKYGSAP